MVDLASLFDTYSRKARLTPALFAILAPALSVAILVPTIYQLIAGLISLMVASGVLIVLANLSRYLGRKVQSRLVEEWGALPSVMMLRHRDDMLDATTKKRYHRFFEANIDQLTMPTSADEEADPISADEKYSSACKWLLERTRDQSKFPMVFKENIEYGFRRNMRGLKPIGLALSAFGGITSFLVQYMDLLSESTGTGWVAVLLCGMSFAVWQFLVTDDWVFDAATSYATRLLAACDLIST